MQGGEISKGGRVFKRTDESVEVPELLCVDLPRGMVAMPPATAPPSSSRSALPPRHTLRCCAADGY